MQTYSHIHNQAITDFISKCLTKGVGNVASITEQVANRWSFTTHSGSAVVHRLIRTVIFDVKNKHHSQFINARNSGVLSKHHYGRNPIWMRSAVSVSQHALVVRKDRLLSKRFSRRIDSIEARIVHLEQNSIGIDQTALVDAVQNAIVAALKKKQIAK
jgi:hypothetical protein